jgi:phage shock protein PspC (stress-responsive transcriptional regulator)
MTSHHEPNGRVKLPVWFILWMTGICLGGLGGYLDMRDKIVRFEVVLDSHIAQSAGPRIAWIPKKLLSDVASADTVLVTDVPIIIAPKE